MFYAIITKSLIGSWFNLKGSQTKHISGGYLVRVPGLSTIASRWELVNKMKCKFNVEEKNKANVWEKTIPIQKPTQS